MFGLPHNLLAKLQTLQNAAACVVTLSNKYSHITPVLKSLHWLPLEKRVVFKIILLLFHCIHGPASQYNIGLIKHYFPYRQLRYQNSGLPVTHRVKTKWGGGGRTVAHAGPSLWNTLPQWIKNSSSAEVLKNSLTKYLFNLAYN